MTNAAPTATAAANGEVVAVSRRDHLCAALNARLGFDDVCGLNAVTRKQAQAAITQIASGLPSDGYGRGATMPVLPNDPTLFYRAGTENICAIVAAAVIDVPTAKQTAGVTQWSSAKPDAAIADFVGDRHGPAGRPTRAPRRATTLLKSHFTDAMTMPGRDGLGRAQVDLHRRLPRAVGGLDRPVKEDDDAHPTPGAPLDAVRHRLRRPARPRDRACPRRSC